MDKKVQSGTPWPPDPRMPQGVPNLSDPDKYPKKVIKVKRKNLDKPKLLQDVEVEKTFEEEKMNGQEFLNTISKIRARVISIKGIGKKQKEEVVEKFQEFVIGLAEELELANAEIEKAVQEYFEEEDMEEGMENGEPGDDEIAEMLEGIENDDDEVGNPSY